MALGDTDVHSAWQAWHLWRWAGSGGALGSRVDTAAVCAAGVALGDIDLHWQAWLLALGDINVHFAWQAWHLGTSSFIFVWPA